MARRNPCAIVLHLQRGAVPVQAPCDLYPGTAWRVPDRIVEENHQQLVKAIGIPLNNDLSRRLEFENLASRQ